MPVVVVGDFLQVDVFLTRDATCATASWHDAATFLLVDDVVLRAGLDHCERAGCIRNLQDEFIGLVRFGVESGKPAAAVLGVLFGRSNFLVHGSL